MATREAKVGNLVLASDRLFLVAGPCVIESLDLCRRIAEHAKAVADRLKVPLVFKASYDKANRTSGSSFRGPGIDEGLAILASLRDEFRLPVLADVHTPAEAQAAGKVLDCLQVPAFLCRQTDLVESAARNGKAVNLKKGQFLAPWDMKPVKKGRGSGRQKHPRHGTRNEFRLQPPRGRHDGPADASGARPPRRLRRDS